MTFWFCQGDNRAGERVSVVTCHDQPSELPAIQSQIVLPVSGTDIPFDRRIRSVRGADEVHNFLDVVQQLYAIQVRTPECG